ncbi:hypothetical protein [Pectobacterium sp. LFLA-215]|uniref:hypothetical protein n=1 Tax=Pectobacterium sp. LFLA-215 TaxID=3419008 RepID=UPI003F5B2684
MTLSTLPNKLWRPLSEVKSYVEKIPDGVLLTDLNKKVDVFSSLSQKEKKQLIEFLGNRESIFVVKGKKQNSANEVTILRHKKYGYPRNTDDMQILKELKTKVCSRCHEEKNKSEFYANNTRNDGLQSYCKKCVKSSTHERSWKKGDDYAKHTLKNNSERKDMTNAAQPATPESLRKQAEALLKAADEEEQKRNATDFFNKKLSPVRLEVLQQASEVEKQFDELMDSMATLKTALIKLKELKA